jgi:hypothetical protein
MCVEAMAPGIWKLSLLGPAGPCRADREPTTRRTDSMSESAERPGKDQEKEQIPEGGGKEEPFGAEKDQAGSEGMDAEMGVGGYEGRDPTTDMPRIPSVPETQDDPMSHEGAPDGDEEPPASN